MDAHACFWFRIAFLRYGYFVATIVNSSNRSTGVPLRGVRNSPAPSLDSLTLCGAPGARLPPVLSRSHSQFADHS
eukprot:6212477-Pleurochrysis_carterae.AAC.5